MYKLILFVCILASSNSPPNKHMSNFLVFLSRLGSLQNFLDMTSSCLFSRAYAFVFLPKSIKDIQVQKTIKHSFCYQQHFSFYKHDWQHYLPFLSSYNVLAHFYSWDGIHLGIPLACNRFTVSHSIFINDRTSQFFHNFFLSQKKKLY